MLKRRVVAAGAALVDSPLPLALLRIVVPLVILLSPELHDGPRLAASPELLRFVPEGLGVVASMPLSPGVVRALQLLAFSSAATAILGYWSRLSMLVLAISAGLVFSFSQRQGAVVHDMHLFWFAALLTASPCGDAWALDAWGKPRPARSTRYGVPLMTARVLLGLVYFFPGLRKVLVSGLAWMTSGNVIGQMHAKWLEHGKVPFLRVDHAPLLCAIGAVGVVAFELSFLFLAAHRPARRIAMAAGLVFHFSTQIFFFITFTSLWACYVVLLDADWLERIERWLGRHYAKELPIAPLRESYVAGALLIVIVAIQGARGMTQAWPFACYPTFAHLQGDEIPDIVVETKTTDGQTLRLTGRERAGRSQAEWGRVFRLSGAYGEEIDEGALRAYAIGVLARSSTSTSTNTSVRVYRVMVSTVPERWSEAPTGGVLLTELSPPLL